MTDVTGGLIVLNGSSSAGKSTLAAAMQAECNVRGQCWLVVGIDDFLGLLPAPWIGYFEAGAFADDGVRFERAGDDVVLRIGPIGAALLSAYRRSVAVLVRTGLNVIVDEVVVNEAAWTGWASELSGLDPFWVGVHCSPEVSENRERLRNDRMSGLARSQVDAVHRYPQYDFTVDTSATAPAELATAVLQAHSAR